MSLPTAAIDRLFKRLAATYGAAWDRAVGAAPKEDVRAVWAHELAGFAGDKMHCIAWALEHLPERCPNALEFRNLCRQAPGPALERLPAPTGSDPAKVQAALAAIHAALSAPSASPKSWARKAVDAALAGQPVGVARLRMACEVLGLRAQEVRRAAAGGQQLPGQWGA